MRDFQQQPELKELLTSATIQDLYFHPLKSGRRQRLEVAHLTPRGILHDRELMAVNENDYMVSQRTDPRLALITTTINPDEFTMEAEGRILTVPLLKQGAMREVTVHSSKGLQAIDQGDEIAEFVSEVVGKRVRIVRMQDDFARTIKQEYFSPLASVSNEVGFADGAALLLTAQRSVRKVNEWIEQDTPGYPSVPIDNFRGNMEIDGFGFDFAEDYVRVAQAGNVRLHLLWLCSRCEETTVNQITAEHNPRIGDFVGDPTKGLRQPLYSLTLHRVGEYAPGKRGALFGVNVQPEFLDDNPVLTVGSQIEILE